MSAGRAPQVGVSVFVYRDGRLLFGKRKKLYGRGLLQIPGGALEYGESFEACIARELMEEAAITLTGPVELVAPLNFVVDDPPAHWVALKFLARHTSGGPVNMEPGKNGWWKWYALDRLPDPANMFEVGPVIPALLAMLRPGEPPRLTVGLADRRRAIQEYRRAHPAASPPSIAAALGVSVSTVHRALRDGGMLRGKGSGGRSTLTPEQREEVRRLHFIGDGDGHRLDDEELRDLFGVTLSDIHKALIRVD